MPGDSISRSLEEVLIKEDIQAFLLVQYKKEGITATEVESIIKDLQKLPSLDLYDSNKTFLNRVRDGFVLKREDRTQKDLFVQLINFEDSEKNTFKMLNQLTIVQYHPEGRIPDGILYINGMPLVVFEFKSAIREEATLFSAYDQITNRYRRDIPELFKYNAFCVISDGVNSRAGSFFAPYEFFYSWRKITGNEENVQGIDAMHSMIEGMFQKDRLLDIIHNFIYIPDSSKKDEKRVCRYPQYYAARKLFENIKVHQKPGGDGKAINDTAKPATRFLDISFIPELT